MKVTVSVRPSGPPRAGIRFNSRIFSEPAPFALAEPPVSSGIYVVLVPDASCNPRAFRAIYFGEAGNFHDRVMDSHELFDDWIREAEDVGNLYVAFCPTPLLREVQRRWVQNDLIARYRPVCNLKDNQTEHSYQPLLRIAK